MAQVRLRGLNSATKRLGSGKVVTYWYAWRGGPRLDGSPGSPEFLASYAQAIRGRITPTAGTLRALVARYKASPEWARMAANTKREWSRWLDRIAEDKDKLAIGAFSFAALSDPDVRGPLLEWRDQWAATPRSADYAVQVLSRVLSWGENRRLLKINAASGIDDLYVNNRADVIWTAEEIAAFTAQAASPEVGFILRLACLTGMRREDLARLEWGHCNDVAIALPTGKSGGRKNATVPLLAETKLLLAEIRAQQALRGFELGRVLTNTRGKPWTPSGLTHAVGGFVEGKRLHDARGTFGTRLRLAGLTAPEIADVLGWEEKRVVRLLATYIDRDTIVRAIAERIAKNEAGA